MEQLAEDMRLLGLPYLLGKAAGVAADFEAQGSDGTALAFVEAIIAIKDTLKHPELAGLDAACASMGTSEICRPGVASESQYILSDRAETCDESQNGHLSSKLSQPPGEEQFRSSYALRESSVRECLLAVRPDLEGSGRASLTMSSDLVETQSLQGLPLSNSGNYWPHRI